MSKSTTNSTNRPHTSLVNSTTTKVAGSPLQDFVSLNGSVYLFRPSSIRTESQDGPDVILLMGWMDSTPRHLSKYTAHYRTIYPHAAIIVVITTIKDAVFSRTHQNVTRILPVVQYLKSIAQEGRAPKILLHSFSNGGGYSTMLILQQWKERSETPLSVQAMILDSSPGIPTLSRTVAAMAVSLPKNPILRFLGVMTLRVLYLFFILAYELSRRVDWVRRMRAFLNDPAYLDTTGRRLYIFSQEDPMVDWRDVVSHAEDAKSKGYESEMEIFKGSGHCSHMLLDGQKYWGLVKQTWEAA